MVVCGGDGSIGWALSVMDLMNIPLGKNQATDFYAKQIQYMTIPNNISHNVCFSHIIESRPAIGIIPLGTGNDLSRILGWGGKLNDIVIVETHTYTGKQKHPDSAVDKYLSKYILGRYIDKPLQSVLSEMMHAKVQNMDRWSIEAEIDESITQIRYVFCPNFH